MTELEPLNEYKTLHQKISNMSGVKAQKFFRENPKEHERYHELYKLVRKTWKDQTPIQIAFAHLYHKHSTVFRGPGSKKIIVGDFGCGKGVLLEKNLHKHFPDYFDVRSLDHIKDESENIIECNLENLRPLFKKNFFDVVVLSHSLMGKWEKSLREAFRTLKPGGKIIIVDETSTIGDFFQFRDLLLNIGFDKKDIGFEPHDNRFWKVTASKPNPNATIVLLPKLNFNNTQPKKRQKTT